MDFDRTDSHVWKEIHTLFKQLLKLVVESELSPKTLILLRIFFKHDNLKTVLSTPLEITSAQVNKVLLFDQPKELLTSNSPGNMIDFVEDILCSQVLPFACSAMKQFKFSTTQHNQLLTLFLKMQPYLDTIASQTLIQLFSIYIIKLMNNPEYDEATIPFFCYFLTGFYRYIPGGIDQVIKSLCSLLLRQNQYLRHLITSIVAISRNYTNDMMFGTIKEKLLQKMQFNIAPDAVQELYIIMPYFASKVNFSVSDLSKLLIHAYSHPKEATKCITTVAQTINDQMDDFARALLSYNVVTPDLHLFFLDKVGDDGIAFGLLTQVIIYCSPERDVKITIKKMSERSIRFILSEFSTDEYLLNIGCFLSQVPKTDLICEFINRLFHHKCPNISSCKVLLKMEDVCMMCDYEKILGILFSNVIELITSSKAENRNISPIIDILIKWTKKFKTIPENVIFTKLNQIDYLKCPNNLPNIIDAVLSRVAPKASRQLIFKIAKDTVIEKYANWAMRNILMTAHLDQTDISRAFDQIVSSLGEEQKKLNAIFMILNGAIFESDFYRIEGQFCYVQSFLIDNKEIAISFHPFHSTRRIFAEVANNLNVNILNISISYRIGQHINPITYKSPLSTFPFRLNETIELFYEISDHFVNTDEDIITNDNDLGFCTPFLDFLGIEENMSLIYQCMRSDSYEDYLIYLILTLFDKSTLRNVLTDAPIQSIYRRDFVMTFENIEKSLLFPYILKSAADTGQSFSVDYIEACMMILSSSTYDNVTTAIAADSLTQLGCNYVFSPGVLKQCLIDAPSSLIRDAFAAILSTDINESVFLSLLHLTIRKENRTNSHQYYLLLQNIIKNSDYLIPFYKELKQYETDFDHKIDYTFIGMMKILPQTQELFNLTFDRLFSPPTCRNPTLPFVHTLEARKAGYKYLAKFDCFDQIKTILSRTNGYPVRKLSKDISFIGQNMINSSLIQPCFVHLFSYMSSFMNVLSTSRLIKPFISKYRTLFYQHKYVRYLMNSLESPLPQNLYNVDLQSELAHFLNEFDYEIEDASLVQRLFVIKSKASQYFLKIDNKKYKNLKDAFSSFEKEVTSWPQYLFIYIKDSSTFSFPLFFSPGYSTCNYKFAGLIAQNRSKKSFFTISNCEKGKWVLCTEKTIEPFDISTIKKITKIEILLFKRDEEQPLFNIPVPNTDEEMINKLNTKNWFSIVCATTGFTNFILDFTKERELTNGIIELLTHMLFKLALGDKYCIYKYRNYFINKVLTNEENSQIFINIFFEDYFTMLVALVNGTAAAATELPIFLTSALKNMASPMTYISQILNMLKSPDTENLFVFLCQFMANIIILPNINWSMEIESISFMINKIYIGKNNNDITSILNTVLAAFDALLKFLIDHINEADVQEIAMTIFNEDFLETCIDIERESRFFNDLATLMNKKFPSLANELEGISDQVAELLSGLITAEDKEQEEMDVFPYGDMFKYLAKFLFSEEKENRITALRFLLCFLKKTNIKFRDYINKRIIDRSLSCPGIPQSTTLCELVRNLLVYAIDLMPVSPGRCDVFCALVERIFYFEPYTILNNFSDFLTLFQYSMIGPEIGTKIMELIHHIISLDERWLKKIPEGLIKKLLNANYKSIYGVQLLIVLDDGVTTGLACSCIDYCFEHAFNEYTQALINLIENGLSPINFTPPNEVVDILNLKLASALWNHVPESRNSLIFFIRSCIQMAEPQEIYKETRVIQEASKLIDQYDIGSPKSPISVTNNMFAV